MAKTLYPKGAEKILAGAINFSADTIKVALLSNGYTYSASHEFFSAVAANIVGTAQTLTGKTIAGGVFDAADADFDVVAPGSTVTSFAIYKSTGSDATSPLIIYSTEALGLPMNTSGGTIGLPWNKSSTKIMSLV